MATSPECPLCRDDGGLLVVRCEKFRVIRATGPDEADFPGFYRVVWHSHVAEFTDLAPEDRSLLMRAVTEVESALREHLAPAKVNLASLGNVVPHLHWHVVARFHWDTRWPAPVWAAAARARDEARIAALQALLPGCDAAIAARLR